MQNFQENNSYVRNASLIGFKPARLCTKTQWLVVFYAKNPITLKLERHRLTVPVMKKTAERRKYGEKMVAEINSRLYSGWLPFYTDLKNNEFKTFDFCISKFLEIINKEVSDKTKRPDTLRSYTSYLSMIKNFNQIDKKVNLILEFDKPFVVKFLDWIYTDRNCSARTFNNYLKFIGSFVNFCVSRGYLKENFTTTIQVKKLQEKTRQVLPFEIKEKVKTIAQTNSNYFTLCMATYFCFIRRTELTKLKVSDISLINNCITIPGDSSKNKKTETVTIPSVFTKLIAEQIKNAKNTDYVFSSNNFKTGSTQLQPKKISDEWAKFRRLNKIANFYQFYSLKDTGITDLLHAGTPHIKVRDQARHYDIKITEKYTPRLKTFDEVILNSNFNF